MKTFTAGERMEQCRIEEAYKQGAVIEKRKPDAFGRRYRTWYIGERTPAFNWKEGWEYRVKEPVTHRPSAAPIHKTKEQKMKTETITTVSGYDVNTISITQLVNLKTDAEVSVNACNANIEHAQQQIENHKAAIKDQRQKLKETKASLVVLNRAIREKV